MGEHDETNQPKFDEPTVEPRKDAKGVDPIAIERVKARPLIITGVLTALATVVVGLTPVYVAWLTKKDQTALETHAEETKRAGANGRTKHHLDVRTVEYLGGETDAVARFFITIKGANGSYELSFPENSTFKTVHGVTEEKGYFELPVLEEEYEVSVLMFEKSKTGVLTVARTSAPAPVKPDNHVATSSLYPEKDGTLDRGTTRARVRFSIY
jgi:uncharacterized protein YbjQ (UPF0145 family)